MEIFTDILFSVEPTLFQAPPPFLLVHKCWLLVSAWTVPIVFVCLFFGKISEVVGIACFPGVEKEWLDQSHPAGFEPKAVLELT